MYIHTPLDIYTSIPLYLSLSIYIYIYIHTHIHMVLVTGNTTGNMRHVDHRLPHRPQT